MKTKIMPIVVLSAICITVALLLSVVNMFTGPIIEAAMNDKANAALPKVLPEGKDFEEIDLSSVTLPNKVTKAYREKNGMGYVFETTTKGYGSGFIVMTGIDAEGKITGSECIASNETFGFESLLDNAYNGKTIDDATLIIAAGASRNSATSSAYFDGIDAALKAFAVLNGANVDIRTPEEILNDNLNLALGTEGKTFEKWFATEEIGADALYITDGGVVALADGYYVGISPDGNASTEGVNAETGEKQTIGDATYATVNSTYVVYSGATLTEVTLPEGAHKNVLAAYATESGNYVFELKAAGYGINGEWHTSGEYIKLKVAISSEGKIISTLTTYQSESEGIGDICANPDYYEQYNGKAAENYDGVENVAGATYTTSGYKKAIGHAFKAFELLKGGEVNE